MNSQFKIRKHLLNVSESLFIKHGYTATSTRMIADASDVNIAMINYYFVSKENLLDSVITRMLKRLSAGIRRWRSRACGGNAWQRIQLLFRFTSDYFTSNPTMMGFMISATRFLDKECHRNKAAACLRSYAGFVEELIVAGQHEKLFRTHIETEIIVTLLMSFRNLDMLTIGSSGNSIDTSRQLGIDHLREAIERVIANCLFEN